MTIHEAAIAAAVEICESCENQTREYYLHMIKPEYSRPDGYHLGTKPVSEVIARHMTALVAELTAERDQLLGADKTVVEIEMDFDVCRKNLVAARKQIATLEAEVKPMLTEGFKEVQAAVMGDNLRLRGELQAAYQHLAVYWEVYGACPCGAHRESRSPHPHVTGCPTAAAVREEGA